MKTKNKSFRYKGKKTLELGVHSEFLRKHIKRGWHYSFIGGIPKPHTKAELSLLSKFIFGIELSVRFEYFNNLLEKQLKTRDQKLARSIKLTKLSPNKKDYFPASRSVSSRDDKMVLINLRYFCNQNHSDYYDSKFNEYVFNSCYELDSAFWNHCVGEIYCGGIGGYSYGQVDITSIKEYDRLLMLNNETNDNLVRDSFKRKMSKLVKKNNKYEECMEV